MSYVISTGGVSDGNKGQITVSGGGTVWSINSTILSGGTYTPTLTNDLNIDSSTAYACQYAVSSGVCTVSGRFDLDVTLTASSTKLRISLPFASALTASTQVGGTAYCLTIAGLGSTIYADAVNDAALVQFISTDIGSNSWFFIFQYKIV